jgi:hypothetical protein
MTVSTTSKWGDSFLAFCLAFALGGWGCARTVTSASALPASTRADEGAKESKAGKKLEKEQAKEDKKEKKEEKDVPKTEIRNNAASLLADLLGDEKNINKLLIVKHPSPSVKQLVEAISKQADQGSNQLDALAKVDTTLKLDALQLPAGERSARDAESKAQEKALLLSFGHKFEVNLLLGQAQALSYGSNLAKVAADNSSSDEEQRKFRSLQTSLNDLYERVAVRLTGQEPSKS